MPLTFELTLGQQRRKQDNPATFAAYLCDHFTAFAWSYLGEELQDQNFCYIPGEVSHIPRGGKIKRSPLTPGNKLQLYLLRKSEPRVLRFWYYSIIGDYEFLK